MLFHIPCSCPQMSPCADLPALLEVLGAPCCLGLSLSIPPNPWRVAHWSPPPPPPHPRCPTILIPELIIIYTASVEIRPIITVCLFRMCFRQYSLTMIVTKVSDQQKRTARESQMDEKTGVPGRSRLLHNLCQRHLHWIHFVPNTVHWLATTQVANTGIFCPRASKPMLPG